MSDRRIIYSTVIGVFIILLVVMMLTWNYDRANPEALAKAQQLISKYQAAGLPTPADAEQVASVLGDDGGAVCEAAGSDIEQGYLKTRLGVGGEFYYRPAIVDAKVLQGMHLIVEVYCPEELSAVEDLQSQLNFDDVVRN
jgi:hypothetical protein